MQRGSASLVFSISYISKSSNSSLLEKLEWESLESRQCRCVRLIRASDEVGIILASRPIKSAQVRPPAITRWHNMGSNTGKSIITTKHICLLSMFVPAKLVANWTCGTDFSVPLVSPPIPPVPLGRTRTLPQNRSTAPQIEHNDHLGKYQVSK